MRAGVWKVAIVVAGLGLFVALGHSVAGQGAVAEQDRPAPPWGTQVEVVIHRLVPQTWLYPGTDGSIMATRDEHAMLQNVEPMASLMPVEGHAVHFTLVNHTDRGYLISLRTLHNQFKTRVAYADREGRVWETIVLGRGSPVPGFEESNTIPLLPGGTREMVLPMPHVRIEPPQDPARLEHGMPFPGTLLYTFSRMGKVLARPVEGNALGDEIGLFVNGRGTCEVSFDGPM